jgi:hypothetical protein
MSEVVLAWRNVRTRPSAGTTSGDGTHSVAMMLNSCKQRVIEQTETPRYNPNLVLLQIITATWQQGSRTSADEDIELW